MNEDYKTEIEEEFENDGCLAIAIPAIGIFLLFAFLAKIGFEPGEVWTLIKMLVFPSTWDYQISHEFTHFLRAGIAVGSTVGLIITAVALLTVIDYIKDFLETKRNFICKLFNLIMALLYKIVLFLAVINIIILIIRVFFHAIAGFIVWLW